MEIKGYKALTKNMESRYKDKYEIGKTYSVEGILKFGYGGLNGNGIHFCERIEDTLKYFDSKEDDIIITEVTSLEDNDVFCEEDQDFALMFAARKLRFDRIVPRQEIIITFLTTPYYRTERFLQFYKLTKEEIKLYKEVYQDDTYIMNIIKYYQEHQKDVYEKQHQKLKVKSKEGKL